MTKLTIANMTYEIPKMSFLTACKAAELMDEVTVAIQAAAIELEASDAGGRRTIAVQYGAAEPILKVFEIASSHSDTPLKADDLMEQAMAGDMPAIIDAYIQLLIESGVFAKPAAAPKTQPEATAA